MVEKNNDEKNLEKDNVVDMLLSKNIMKTLDSETMILETQKRVWGALKKGYEYLGVVDESDDFLRKHVFAKLDMVVLYVDLVGSTTMALEMPPEKIAIIMSSFAQEMAAVIRQHHGYVLKFVGDAVIGCFVCGFGWFHNNGFRNASRKNCNYYEFFCTRNGCSN